MLSGIRLKISVLKRMQGTRFVEEALGSREPGADSTGASTLDKSPPHIAPFEAFDIANQINNAVLW